MSIELFTYQCEPPPLWNIVVVSKPPIENLWFCHKTDRCKNGIWREAHHFVTRWLQLITICIQVVSCSLFNLHNIVRGQKSISVKRCCCLSFFTKLQFMTSWHHGLGYLHWIQHQIWYPHPLSLGMEHLVTFERVRLLFLGCRWYLHSSSVVRSLAVSSDQMLS